MLGVGYQEMFIILVAALVIFGPGKLPELAGQAGRWVRDFRRLTADLTGEFEKTMAEVEDVKESVRKEVGGMRAEVEGVSKSVKQDLGDLAPTNGTPKKSPTAAKSATASATAKKETAARPAAKTPSAAAKTAPAVATKADPLADVSFLDDDAPAEKEPTVVGAPTTATGGSGEESIAGGNGAAVAPTRGRGPAGRTVLPAPSGSDGGADGATADALARARKRRAAAGYNRAR